jgi:hypothetical protein
MVRMQYQAELADPLIEVREVVESFRAYGIMLEDWQRSLGEALSVLDRLPQGADQDFLPDLISNIRVLMHQGLDSSPRTLDMVATRVAIVLSEATIPGLPGPRDDNWGFD